MRSPLPVVAVIGLGRSGTTLAMHQLQALGVPMAPGSYPDSGEVHMDVLKGHLAGDPIAPGHAIKLLDSFMHYGLPPAPPGGWVFIWCDRGIREQAMSSLKFLVGIEAIPPERANVYTLDRFALDLSSDRARALGVARSAGPVHEQRFEDVLAQPAKRTKRLARFLTDHRVPVDAGAIPAAAALVHARSPRCADGLDTEADLLRIHKAS